MLPIWRLPSISLLLAWHQQQCKSNSGIHLFPVSHNILCSNSGTIFARIPHVFYEECTVSRTEVLEIASSKRREILLHSDHDKAVSCTQGLKYLHGSNETSISVLLIKLKFCLLEALRPTVKWGCLGVTFS
jgi:hypothetical protein